MSTDKAPKPAEPREQDAEHSEAAEVEESELKRSAALASPYGEFDETPDELD